MSGEDKQLLIGGAAALLVLGLGVAAYLGTPSRPPVEAPASAEYVVPVQADRAEKELERQDGSSTTRRAQKPLLTGTVREPRVRPEKFVFGVERGLRTKEEAFKACYAAELEQDPKARGRALLQLSIDENSEITGANAEMRGIPSMGLKACLLKATEDIVFGEVDEPTVVWWPLDMWPDRGLIIQSGSEAQ